LFSEQKLMAVLLPQAILTRKSGAVREKIQQSATPVDSLLGVVKYGGRSHIGSSNDSLPPATKRAVALAVKLLDRDAR
jgi:hypothetical protein